MNKKNKKVNHGYQLAIIIIELMFFYIKYLYLYFLLTIKMRIIMGIIIIKY
jgi:hypothetical protein